MQRRLLPFAALACLLAAGLPRRGSAQPAPPAQPGSAAGRYALRGIREVAGGLLLRADGRFSFGMSYGAVDERAEGTWRQTGPRVELTVPPPPEPRLSVARWSPDLPSAYTGPGEPPVLLAVRVASSDIELVWSNVDATAEFSNGRSRSGQTGDDGRLAFDERSDPPWRGARIRRVGLGFLKRGVPMVWFDVPPGMRSVEVELAPGRLVPSAFRSMVLLARSRRGEVHELVVEELDGGRVGRSLVFSR